MFIAPLRMGITLNCIDSDIDKAALEKVYNKIVSKAKNLVTVERNCWLNGNSVVANCSVTPISIIGETLLDATGPMYFAKATEQLNRPLLYWWFLCARSKAKR